MVLTMFGFVYPEVCSATLERHYEILSDDDILDKTKVVNALITIWTRLNFYVDLDQLNSIARQLVFCDKKDEQVIKAKQSHIEYKQKEDIRKGNKPNINTGQLSLF
jgi:hypothetical protein